MQGEGHVQAGRGQGDEHVAAAGRGRRPRRRRRGRSGRTTSARPRSGPSGWRAVPRHGAHRAAEVEHEQRRRARDVAAAGALARVQRDERAQADEDDRPAHDGPRQLARRTPSRPCPPAGPAGAVAAAGVPRRPAARPRTAPLPARAGTTSSGEARRPPVATTAETSSGAAAKPRLPPRENQPIAVWLPRLRDARHAGGLGVVGGDPDPGHRDDRQRQGVGAADPAQRDADAADQRAHRQQPGHGPLVGERAEQRLHHRGQQGRGEDDAGGRGVGVGALGDEERARARPRRPGRRPRRRARGTAASDRVRSWASWFVGHSLDRHRGARLSRFR